MPVWWDIGDKKVLGLYKDNVEYKLVVSTNKGMIVT